MMPTTSPTGTASAADPILAALVDELTDRLQAGEPVNFAASLDAHPDQAEALRQLAPALELIGDLKHSAESTEAPQPGAGCDVRLESGVLGDFQILREVGRGGMGVVYEARQVSLGRRVALNVLPFAAAIDPRQLQRFQVEAQAAATLHHTSIVPVFSVDCERGVHYFAMQFIEGRTLADVIRALRQGDGLEPPAGAQGPAPLTGSSARSRAHLRNAVRMGLQVAEALQHAHGQGVLHRDIKPSNLLIDAQGNVWITDFGLARVQRDSGLTMTGDLLGTLRYMSPEQASARRAVIDERSDVYSLGATLYELLTLHPAFEEGDRLEVLRRIAQEEPKPLRKLNPAVPVDLETIVRKAIDKEPAGRYSSAAALAEDLRRFLDSRPIIARPLSLLDRATKWALRHRTVTISTAVVVATVLLTLAVAGVIVASKEHQRGQAALAVERERSRAAVALEHAHSDAAVAVGVLESRLRAQAEERAREGRWRQAVLNVEEATRLMNDGDSARALRYFVEALRLDDDPARAADHRVRLGMLLAQCAKPAPVWFHDQTIEALAFRGAGGAVAIGLADGTLTVRGADDGRSLGPELKVTLADLNGKLSSVRFSPDGDRIAVPCAGGTVRMIDIATGRDVFPPLRTSWIRDLQFSPDGVLLLTSRGTSWRLWNAATGVPVGDWIEDDSLGRSPRADGGVSFFSPDSRFIAGGGRDLRIHEARTGRPVIPPVRHPRDVKLHDERCFSPDARRIVTTCNDNYVRVWDIVTGALAAPPVKQRYAVGATFSPDGRWVLTWCADGMARVFDAATSRLVCEPMRHRGAVTGAVFSPDGALVATRCGDNAVRIWEAASGRLLLPPLRHLGPVREVQFSPDCRFVSTASSDRTFRRWDLAAGGAAGPRLPGEKPGRRFAKFISDGRRVITHGDDGQIRVWEAATGSPSGTPLPLPAGVLRSAQISPDGRACAVLGSVSDHQWAVWIWDVETRRVKVGPLALDYGGPSTGDPVTWLLAWSRDGRRVAAAGGSGLITGTYQQKTAVRVWDAATGAPTTPLLCFDCRVNDLDFSPDGRWLAVANQGLPGEVRIYDASNGSLRLDPISFRWACNTARFSPDGRRLLIVTLGLGNNHTGSDVQLRDPATGDLLAPPISHASRVGSAFFTPDGGRIISVSEAIRVWNAATGAPAGPSMRFSLPITGASLSADGRRVLAACGDASYSGDAGFVQVMDLATGWPITPPLWRARSLLEARFSADGHQVATGSASGDVLLWTLEPDTRPLDDLVRWAEVLSGMRVDEAGATIAITTEELRQSYAALRRKAPESFNASRAQVLGWHYQQLESSEFVGLPRSALAHLDRVIELGPSAAELHARRDAILVRLKPEELIPIRRDSVRLNPDDAGAHRRLAVALDARGLHDEAIAELRESIRLDPDDPAAHLEVAKVISRTGARSEATAEYREAIRLAPDDPAAHFEFGDFLHGDSGARDAELGEFREAARLHTGGTPWAHGELVWILTLSDVARLRNPAEALEHARKAVEITRGEHPPFQSTLALAAYFSGLHEEALAALDKFQALGGKDDATTLFLRAMIHGQKAEKEQAGAWFDRAVAWMKAQSYPDMYHRLLWTEAAGLLGLPGPDGRVPNDGASRPPNPEAAPE
jgi:WD40 repeat protein/serine/threonine protein kinase/Tfp pilus assembly protein PilF